ncbi:Quinonprotein alcohol dehydrogenase-like superfamily [Tylopilus felleus]
MSKPSDDELEEPQPQLVIQTHTGMSIQDLKYLPHGRLVISDWDGFVEVWNLEKGEQEGTSLETDQDGDFGCLAVTRDGTKIVWSLSGLRHEDFGVIEVFDVESHRLIKKWTHPHGNHRIVISPDDRLIAVAGGRSVGFYTLEGEQVNDVIKIDDDITSLSFSPDGNKLARGNYWGEIFVYDVKNRTLVLGPLHGHSDCRCVLWSRDGNRLFSASDVKKIRCWNANTGKQIGEPWTGHTGLVRSLSLSPDGRILASASHDKTVRFWDATLGHPIGKPRRHDGYVYTV